MSTIATTGRIGGLRAIHGRSTSMTTESIPNWRLEGGRVVRSDALDLNTPKRLA